MLTHAHRVWRFIHPTSVGARLPDASSCMMPIRRDMREDASPPLQEQGEKHMYQRLVLVGNLGRDPETHYSSNGIPIANFSVATNHKWTDVEGQTQEETVWFRVATYGKLAETCQQYLTKGQKVLVEGTLVADPKNGGPRV